MKRLLPAIAIVLLGLTRPAFGLGLYVERLADLSTHTCPVCHRVIVPGGIHESAETVLTTEFGAALQEKGLAYTTDKGQTTYLEVLVYRFQERRGGNFSVERPASVGFHVHLFEGDVLQKVVVFDETQQPLLQNVLGIVKFLRRGAKWVTAGELAREGVEKAVDGLAADLRPAAKEGAP